MSQTIFDNQTKNYELFDASRYRVIFWQTMSAEEAEKTNAHFVRSLCPHLQFRIEQSRRYVIIRGEYGN